MAGGLVGRTADRRATTVVTDTAAVQGRGRWELRGKRTGQQRPIQGTNAFMRHTLQLQSVMWLW